MSATSVALRAPELAGELSELAQRLCASTVQMRVRGGGNGSGVIWRAEGLVVTNAHVARRSRLRVELADGRELDGAVVARDPWRDLAAVAIDANGLSAAAVGDSAALRVGQLVFAAGCPWGVSGALACGIIHRVGAVDGLGDLRWVQADVRLAPGNSGGALADARGRVIGVNSMIARGLGLAVPSAVVERFVAAGGRPYIGVTARPVRVTRGGEEICGMLVLDVTPRSPAAEGLRQGDVLIGAAGRFFARPSDLVAAIDAAGPGGTLRLDLLRGGSRRSCDVTVRSPERADRAA